MTQYIRAARGQFAGSVGAGRDTLPTPACTPVTAPAADPEPVNLSEVRALCTPEPVPVQLEGVDGEYFDVTPGVIDAEAQQAYMNGQCHALAFALAEKTGWRVVSVMVEYCTGDPYYLEDEDDPDAEVFYMDDDNEHRPVMDGRYCYCQFRHVMCMDDDGNMWDIFGRQDEHAALTHYDYPMEYQFNEELVRAFVAEETTQSQLMPIPNLQVARTMVQPLLAQQRLRDAA